VALSDHLGLNTVALLALVIALAVWAISLNAIDIRDLGKGGLSPALPFGWFAALSIAVLGASLLT
jgi:hypothetical protein